MKPYNLYFVNQESDNERSMLWTQTEKVYNQALPLSLGICDYVLLKRIV
jgi:hypothetical protein